MNVGIDLVSADDVRAALRDHGDRYLRRVYTPAEVADCGGPAAPDPEALARRFAAKEAALKVLRPDGAAVPWSDVEVRTTNERVELVLTGRAAALAAERRIGRISVTMTTERDLAAAVAVAADEHR